MSSGACRDPSPPPDSPDGHAGPPREPGYFEVTRDLSVSLILVLPLLALYQAGLFLVGHDVINGADFITRFVYPSFGLKGLVLANLAIVAAFLAAIIRLERKRRFRPALFVPLLVESTAYAWLLGTVIVFIMQKAHVLAIGFGGPVRNLVLSIGAGVNEELVFRLGLIGILEYAFVDFAGVKEAPARVAAILASSFLFSAAHYIGPLGDRLELASFVYRFLAGLIFAGIYRLRSFAVAVYTHAIYDIMVLVL